MSTISQTKNSFQNQEEHTTEVASCSFSSLVFVGWGWETALGMTSKGINSKGLAAGGDKKEMLLSDKQRVHSYNG